MTYTAVSCGWYHTAALRSDGQIVVWGMSTWGQRTVPALPSGLSYVSLSAGAYHTLAIRSDGTVVAWGSNFYGETTVPSGLQTVRQVAAGALFSAAMGTDGSITVWGLNDYLQSPAPSGVAPAEMIALGDTFAVAVSCVSRFQASGQSAAAAGESGSIGVVTNGSGCVWSATSDSAWVVLTAGTESGGGATGAIAFEVSPNLTGVMRVGKISLSSDIDYTITQGAATAPEAPSAVAAAAGDQLASITFTDPSSDGGLPITNYEFSLDSGVSWTACSPAVTTSPIDVPGLTNGIAYSIQLRAVNGMGGGASSASVSVTPHGPAAKYLVTVSSTSPTAGGAVTVTAQLADSGDNAVPTVGQTVTWSTSFAGSGVAF